MNKLKVIILAAGEGKRMKSKLPKVLHKVQGKPMVKHVIDMAKNAGADDICVVIGHGGDAVKAALEDENVKFAIQEKQLGTGHAVMQAGDFIEDNADILVLYGDTPLVTPETVGKLLDFHRTEENSISIISAIVDDPTGYGHIIRDENGAFLKNVEHKDADDIEKAVKEINTGIYCFRGEALKKGLSMLKNARHFGDCTEKRRKGERHGSGQRRRIFRSKLQNTACRGGSVYEKESKPQIYGYGSYHD